MSALEGFDGMESMIAMGAGELGTTISRRRLLRLGGSVGVAAMAGMLLKTLPASAAAGSGMRTLTSLNLRSYPSTSGQVLAVMPYGSLLKIIGKTKNGYIHVKYQGTNGWAAEDLMISTNPDLWPYLIAYGTTTKKARIRAYPVPDADTSSMAPTGADIQLSEKVVDGYRFVAYNGTKGWMLDSAIGDVEDGIHPGDHVFTTANVNMREQPSTSAKVMLVVPAGSDVLAWAESENGFRTVSYGEHSGWVSEAYLEK